MRGRRAKGFVPLPIVPAISKNLHSNNRTSGNSRAVGRWGDVDYSGVAEVYTGRTMKIPRFPPNSILLTNTSLVEASRFVVGFKSATDDRNAAMRRLIEFCGVAEAVVLNDRIYVLASKQLDSISSLGFLRSLKEFGICKTLGPSVLTVSATQGTFDLLGRIGNNAVYSMAIPYASKHIPMPWSSDVLTELPHTQPYLQEEIFDRQFFEEPESEAGQARKLLPIEKLISNMWSMVSPSTSYVAQQIRGVFYWTFAEQTGLSFAPDLRRTQWLAAWLKLLKTSITQEIYAEAARAFLTDAQSLLKEDRKLNLLLPPIAATLAARAQSKKTLITELFALRDEFAPFRSSLRALEEQRGNARSLAELRRVRSAINGVYKSVATKYKNSRPMTFETAVGLTGEAARIAIAPMKPDSYLSLLAKGADWVHTWWGSRPIFRLTSLTDRLESMPNYSSLARKLVGREPSENEIATFSDSYRPASG